MLASKKSTDTGAIYMAIYFSLLACAPQSSKVSSRQTKIGRSEAQSRIAQTPGSTTDGRGHQNNTPITRPKVSAFEIDDRKFSLIQLTVGIQTFMTSETPVISYKIPAMADYVEILRCRNNTPELSGLRDLELKYISEAAKAHEYRSRDYFAISEASRNCELITDGHAGADFFDNFAPSGSFVYLVRACISPKRLTQQEQLSSRNCSRRVGISTELNNFVNKRRRKEVQALKMTAVYGAKIDATTNTMQHLAGTANTVLEECSERNRQRLITKKIRDAWLTLFSAALEVGIELKTSNASENGGIIKHYNVFGRKGAAGKGEALFDLTQLLGATQGMIFADTFIKLSASSHDMTRTCATYKRLLDTYTIQANHLENYAFKYQYYLYLADLARTGQLVSSGQEVKIPAVEDIRIFEDLPVPEVSTPQEAKEKTAR